MTGSFWLVVLDSQKNVENGENYIDEFSIPMTFFVPYRPMHLEVTLNDGVGKIFITLMLTLKEGLPKEAMSELVTFGLKWASFDPLPNCVLKVAYLIAPCGFKNGQSLPWVKCATRDPNSFSRAFYQ